MLNSGTAAASGGAAPAAAPAAAAPAAAPAANNQGQQQQQQQQGKGKGRQLPQLTPQQLRELPVLGAQLGLVHEYQLAEVLSALSLSFKVRDDTLKNNLVIEVEKDEGRRKVRCLEVMALYLGTKGVAGSGRFGVASGDDLNAGVVRFKPKFAKPMQGKWWEWTLVLSSSCPRDLREALSDMELEGGCAGVEIRRPFARIGAIAADVERILYPQRAADREANKGKGKGKGSGRGNGNGGGRGKGDGGGRGKGKGKGQFADVDMGGADVAAAAAGGAAPPAMQPPAGPAPAGPALAGPAGPAPASYTGNVGGDDRERSRSPSGPRMVECAPAAPVAPAAAAAAPVAS
jgi:hypothetical protein